MIYVDMYVNIVFMSLFVLCLGDMFLNVFVGMNIFLLFLSEWWCVN